MKSLSFKEPYPAGGPRDRFWLVPALGYSLLIVYGTLFPLVGWQWPAQGVWDALLLDWPARLSKSDVIINLLAYMPFGLFWARALAGKGSGLRRLSQVVVMGALLSLAMEWGQAFLPNRVSSLADWVLNVSGTLIGALLIKVLPVGEGSLPQVRKLRQTWCEPGRMADLGLIALGLWILAQLTPLVPSFDLRNLKDGLKPLWHTLQAPATFQSADAAVYALYTLALGAVLMPVLRHRRHAPWVLLGLTALILLGKVPVVSRQLSLEALLGSGGGWLAFVALRPLGERFLAVAGMLSLVVGFVLSGLQPVPGAAADLRPMNWIPFRGHMTNIVGLAAIFATLWPFWSLAYLARFVARERYGKGLILGAGLAVVVLVLLVERAQRFIPGRTPDVTDVLLAALGWVLPWMFSLRRSP